MYHPTTRLLTVLELLQARGTLQTSDLATRLEVDGRSVRRYIAMLRDLGIPIESERGRYGGYRLRPGYKLPPLMLTDDEALAVTLGLLAAHRLGLADAAPAVEGALAKIDRVLPAVVREQVQAVQDTVVFDVPSAEMRPASTTVRAFSIAARQGRRLQIRYRSAQATTERAVDPYGLVYRLGSCYAVGWCHLRDAPRVFRLDRVEDVTILDETFVPPTEFDCRQYVQQSLATMPSTWSVELLLETTLEEIQRWFSPIWGTLERVPDGVLLRCQIDCLEQMAYYVLRMPCPVVVRDPPKLVAALQALAERIAHCVERASVPVHA